jgi:aspartate/methionine/tyrosine aminotransferase
MPSQASPRHDPGLTSEAARPTTPRLARRVVTLGVERAFEVLAAARRLEAAGRPIAHLEAGEPDFPTPAHVIEAGVRALRDGFTKYSASPGIPELRAAVADSMAWRGVHTSADAVVVTAGSKLALFHVLLALLEPGDEVLYPDPGYPAYESVSAFAGAHLVPYSVDPARADGVDMAELAAKMSPRTRVLILNSPHNPTGTAIGADALSEIAALAERHDVTVISDEIYGRLTFTGSTAPSIAALPGMASRTVIVDGFSKTYAMTGWRLGYGVMPAPVAAAVTKLVNNSTACTPVFVQLAGVAALRGPQAGVGEMVEALRRRRDVVVAALSAMPGVVCPTPHGAFYVFPDVRDALRRLDVSSDRLAAMLLDDHDVACLPGTAFGAFGRGYLRFSYTASLSSIEAAMTRVAACLRDTGRP